jgi:hypothetical protein
MAGYLIWSNQQRMWWRPNERGYTEFVDEAGRYDRATADRIVARATCDGRLTVSRQDPVTDAWYEQLDEVLILAPEDTPGPAVLEPWESSAPLADRIAESMEPIQSADDDVPDGRVIGRAPVDEPGVIVGDTAVEQRDNAYAAYERDEAEYLPTCPECMGRHHTVEPCR